MVTLLGAAPAPAIAATVPASVADAPVAPVAPLKLALDGARLTLPDMLHIVRGNPVELSLAPRAARAMRQARGGALTALDGGQRVYG
ncbi:hypothetical protein AB0H77_09005 [Streptomyces sp. NPDC050844]|uniref:hypothetical protein n=1 Tax=Streptomyces sp. NPDC050844 TaxID=3155790 RepID=UPI0033EDE7AD